MTGQGPEQHEDGRAWVSGRGQGGGSVVAWAATAHPLAVESVRWVTAQAAEGRGASARLDCSGCAPRWLPAMTPPPRRCEPRSKRWRARRAMRWDAAMAGADRPACAAPSAAQTAWGTSPWTTMIRLRRRLLVGPRGRGRGGPAPLGSATIPLIGGQALSLSLSLSLSHTHKHSHARVLASCNSSTCAHVRARAHTLTHPAHSQIDTRTPCHAPSPASSLDAQGRLLRGTHGCMCTEARMDARVRTRTQTHLHITCTATHHSIPSAGCCACPPARMYNRRVHAHVTPACKRAYMRRCVGYIPCEYVRHVTCEYTCEYT